MIDNSEKSRRSMLLTVVFVVLSVGLCWVPTGYENRVDETALQCKSEITAVDNSQIQQFTLIKTGHQALTVKILDGVYEGQEFEVSNLLQGRMDLDKMYEVGDTALTVITLHQDGSVDSVVAQDYYRLDLELMLLVLFAVLLVAFGGWTGAKAMLSFVFSALMLWKLLVPALLQGYDPLFTAMGVTASLTASIIFLVAGFTRMGVVAFLGAMLGIGTSCLLAIYFTAQFHITGAVLPFIETMLYSGYAHLDITRIYVAAVFLAASGAVMDLAMDVAASMREVVEKRPDMSRREVLLSGLRVGRAVVGTMTTTLLLAYSGGYITLLMAFMAQGVPISNLFNLIYVAAEVLKTLVGSFGLVLVAPFTAVVGAFIYTGAGFKWKTTSTLAPSQGPELQRLESESGL